MLVAMRANGVGPSSLSPAFGAAQENHKTRKSWHAWLVFKVFIFQFVNTNAALVYIAIIKPMWYEMYGLDRVGEDTIIEQCAA